MNPKEFNTASYDEHAQKHIKKFSKTGVRTKDVSEFFSYFEKENPFVLEIGCGNGRDAVEIIKYTDRYLGIDISKEFIKIAKSAVPQAEFEVADIEEYEFPDSLDGVISFASLLHTNKETLGKILKHAAEKLHDRGIFLISLKKKDYHEEGDLVEDEFGKRLFDYYQPEDILELAGDYFEQVDYSEQSNINGKEYFVITLRKK